MLLKLVAQQKLPVDKFVTHRFAMDDILAAYETFGNAAETQALKVLISRGVVRVCPVISRSRR
jgi:alcohol dehydrogenase